MSIIQGSKSTAQRFSSSTRNNFIIIHNYDTDDVNVDGWMKRGACGNVMHGLTSLCHEAGNVGNNGRRYPKHARTVFLPDLDSIMMEKEGK